MGSDWRDVEVRCPFYKAMGIGEIKCEGISADNAIYLVFSTREGFAQHREKFCFANYEKCAIAKMLDAKYPR